MVGATNETVADFMEYMQLYGPRLFAALLSGAFIGAENQIFGKPAGLRTNILVTFACALITIVSIESGHLYGSEPTRITAQILTGIGFIGGGVILRRQSKISGITTAVTILVCSGVGITCGTGLIYTGLFESVIACAVLILLRPVDRFIDLYPPFLRVRERDRQHRKKKIVRAKVELPISPPSGEGA